MGLVWSESSVLVLSLCCFSHLCDEIRLLLGLCVNYELLERGLTEIRMQEYPERKDFGVQMILSGSL